MPQSWKTSLVPRYLSPACIHNTTELNFTSFALCSCLFSVEVDVAAEGIAGSGEGKERQRDWHRDVDPHLFVRHGHHARKDAFEISCMSRSAAKEPNKQRPVDSLLFFFLEAGKAGAQRDTILDGRRPKHHTKTESVACRTQKPLPNCKRMPPFKYCLTRVVSPGKQT